MEADNRQFDGKLFLKDVNRKLNDRLAEIQKDLNQGLKEIENALTSEANISFLDEQKKPMVTLLIPVVS